MHDPVYLPGFFHQVLDYGLVCPQRRETGPAGGTYHAVDEEGIPFREIVEVIGRRLNRPVVKSEAKEMGLRVVYRPAPQALNRLTTSGSHPTARRNLIRASLVSDARSCCT